ncbi:hypothetical protein CNMCM8686_007996 [Aspergillus fumigatus]|nr:hypothetical protein CNMCM8686_007996 [Aspergillus fumigatus]
MHQHQLQMPRGTRPPQHQQLMAALDFVRGSTPPEDFEAEGARCGCVRLRWDGGPFLGWPGAAWHLELVLMHGNDEANAPKPTEEDLLVIYVDGAIEPGVVGDFFEESC